VVQGRSLPFGFRHRALRGRGLGAVHPRLDESGLFYPDPSLPVPVARILPKELDLSPTSHKRRRFYLIRGRDLIASDMDYFDDGGDRPAPWIEIPAAFFTADQSRRMEFELWLIRQAPTDIVATADGWLKEVEVVRSRAQALKERLSGRKMGMHLAREAILGLHARVEGWADPEFERDWSSRRAPLHQSGTSGPTRENAGQSLRRSRTRTHILCVRVLLLAVQSLWTGRRILGRRCPHRDFGLRDGWVSSFRGV